MTQIVVVGGGISGLTSAYRLRRRFGPEAEIVLAEQGHQLGGKVRTGELAGRNFDVGAEAFLARRPEVVDLAEELDLGAWLVAPAQVSAKIRAGGRLSALPTRTVMGVPSSADSVRHVLSGQGLSELRAETELPPVTLPAADVSVGALLRERVGNEVVERLVEPLLGGVYAGSADGLGLRATIPALAAALDAGAGTVTAAAEAASPPTGPTRSPVFGAFRGGYGQLIDQLTRRSAVQPRMGLSVRALRRRPRGWRVEIGSASSPETIDADAVVLAVPAPSARALLSDVAPSAAANFAKIELASTIVVGMALPPGTELPESSGVLLGRREKHPDGTPFTAKAFTFSGRKWPHLRGSDGEVLVRASVGRSCEQDRLCLDDAELLRRVHDDFAEVSGVTAKPVDSVIARWGGGLPQYGVGHLDTVAAIEHALARVPGLAVAGAALRGVGVPACVSTGNAAARKLTQDLAVAGEVAVGP